MAKVVVTDYFERLQAPQHELIDTAPRTEIAKTSPQVAPPNRVRPTDSIASKTLAQASWSHRGIALKASCAAASSSRAA
jgi:hypothetical protein